MINKLLLFVVTLIISILVSCGDKNLEFISGSLDNAFLEAKKKEKFLLVVSKNTDCSACDLLSQGLRKDEGIRNKLSNDFIVYEYNLKTIGNEYLSRIFHSIASPTVYVFKPSGEFVTMYQGMKSFRNFESSINGIVSGDKIPEVEKSNLSLSGNNLVVFSNLMLSNFSLIRQKNTEPKILEQGVFDLERSLQVRDYFFNNYLLAKLYMQMGNSVKSKQFATDALKFNESFDVLLYQPLRNEMRFMVDEEFSEKAEPVLGVSESEFDYGLVKINSRPTAIFTIKNQGKKPLIINKLLPSCDCMSISYDHKPIAPGKDSQIEVTYEADSQGSFSKLIYVFSNSVKGHNELIVKGVVD